MRWSAARARGARSRCCPRPGRASVAARPARTVAAATPIQACSGPAAAGSPCPLAALEVADLVGAAACSAADRCAGGGRVEELFEVPPLAAWRVTSGPCATSVRPARPAAAGTGLGRVGRAAGAAAGDTAGVRSTPGCPDLEGVPSDQLSMSDLAFHALREYVPGDDLRHVHWRSSAKADSCWSASTSRPGASTAVVLRRRPRLLRRPRGVRDRGLGRGVARRPGPAATASTSRCLRRHAVTAEARDGAARRLLPDRPGEPNLPEQRGRAPARNRCQPRLFVTGRHADYRTLPRSAALFPTRAGRLRSGWTPGPHLPGPPPTLSVLTLSRLEDLPIVIARRRARTAGDERPPKPAPVGRSPTWSACSRWGHWPLLGFRTTYEGWIYMLVGRSARARRPPGTGHCSASPSSPWSSPGRSSSSSAARWRCTRGLSAMPARPRPWRTC